MTVLDILGYQNFQLGIIEMINEYNIPFDLREILICKELMAHYISLEEQIGEDDETKVDEDSK